MIGVRLACILISCAMAGRSDGPTPRGEELLLRGFAREEFFDAAEREFASDVENGDDLARGHAVARLLELETTLRPRLSTAREWIRDHAESAAEYASTIDRERILAAVSWACDSQEEALDASRRVHAADPNDLPSGIVLALRLRSSGELDESLAVLESLAAESPGHPVLTYFVADAARNALHPERAIASLERFVAVSPRIEDAIFGEGLAAEIEARDLAAPVRAASRARRLRDSLAAGGAACPDVARLVAWYEQSVVEAEGLRSRRRHLQIAVLLAAVGFLAAFAVGYLGAATFALRAHEGRASAR